MQKKILLFAGIIILCFIVYGLYLYNKPHESVKNEKAATTLTAAELYQQYNTDEKAADKKFLDRIIEVKGAVKDIEKTDTTFSILLNAHEAMGGINCNLSLTDNKLKALPKQGDSVIVKGKCAGFLMDVTLTGCVLEMK